MNPSVRPNPPVVIHVPKTGGTTLIMAIRDEEMPPRPSDTYRHVYWSSDKKIMHSNCGDLFALQVPDELLERQFLLTLRQPLDRLESEFYFLSNRSEYRDLWSQLNGSSFPDQFIDYVLSDGATDSIAKFLLGRDLFDPKPIPADSGDLILSRLNDLNVVFGLTHKMSATIRNAESRLGITCKQSLRHHRTSIHKPDRGDDWALVEAHFNERNQADLSIYDFVQRAFEDQIQSLPAVDANSEKQFSGDRYDALLGFVAPPASRSPFELFVKELPESSSFYAWIEEHRSALLHLNVMSRKHDAHDGRRFLVEWICRAMKKFPHSGDPIPVDANDPLVAAQAYTLRLFAPEKQ